MKNTGNMLLFRIRRPQWHVTFFGSQLTPDIWQVYKRKPKLIHQQSQVQCNNNAFCPQSSGSHDTIHPCAKCVTFETIRTSWTCERAYADARRCSEYSEFITTKKNSKSSHLYRFCLQLVIMTMAWCACSPSICVFLPDPRVSLQESKNMLWVYYNRL